MGNRISISFVNGEEESVAFFSHWDGEDLVANARTYLRELDKYLDGKKEVMPLDRLEPNTVMVDFVRWFTRNQGRVTNNYYFGKDSSDGDNSDNGHVRLYLKKTDTDALDSLFLAE